MSGERAAGAREWRVLFLVADTTRMAGANRGLLELVRNLPPDRVRPLVLATSEGAVADAFRGQGIRCEVLDPGADLNRFDGALLRTSLASRAGIAVRGLLPFALRLWKLIRRERIDLVHVNDARGALFAALPARMAGVPVVGHLHGEMRLSGLPRWLMEAVPDRIVAVSDGARATLSPRARDRAVTVHYGIGTGPLPAPDVPFLESLADRGVAILCCFATVVPFKGYHHLLEAVALLNARGWRDRLAVFCVGDLIPAYGSYHRWLFRTLRRKGIDNLTFTGWQDVPFSFYRYADATVLPSVSEEVLEFEGERVEVRGNEGLPMTHMEAMRFGVPVVGTRIAGVPEQVEDGVTGLLVEPGDQVALADALERMLECPRAARAMGEAGAERVARLFSTGAYVEGVLRVYSELLPEARTGQGRPSSSPSSSSSNPSSSSNGSSS
ncbi:MAG: glycosyltransferase family 4 protein [Gemmatimonadetes bacterium]|nr:glycosyltransferase family 4 protein [Gemmatimonadota bacterium]